MSDKAAISLLEETINRLNAQIIELQKENNYLKKQSRRKSSSNRHPMDRPEWTTNDFGDRIYTPNDMGK